MGDREAYLIFEKENERLEAEVTRLREALDNLRVPIEETLRHLNPDAGCGYKTIDRCGTTYVMRSTLRSVTREHTTLRRTSQALRALTFYQPKGSTSA